MKIGLLLLLVAVGSFWFLKPTRTELKSQNTPETVLPTVSPTPHPLTISGVVVEQIPTPTLTTERTVRETAKFTSLVVSYEFEGLKQYALLNVPKGARPETGWPVVVVNHGHIPPKQFSTELSYINTSAYFANAGFLVFKPDYRGHDNSQGVADGAVSRIHYARDVIAGLAALQTRDDINRQAIFAYGHSMGGDVTLRILETRPQLLKAASLWAPAVTTYPESTLYFAKKNNDPERLKKLTGEIETLAKQAPLEQFSTLANVSLVQAPVIIHHGTRDESVPYSWGTALRDQLHQAKKSVELYTYANDNHDISGNWSTALNRDIAFFRESMR